MAGLFGWDLAATRAAAGEIDAVSRGRAHAHQTLVMHNGQDGVAEDHGAPPWLQQPFIDFKCLYGVSDRLFVKAAMDWLNASLITPPPHFLIS